MIWINFFYAASALSWFGLATGAVLLACALGLGLRPWAFRLAAALLGLAALVAAAAFVAALARGLRLATIAFLVTCLLGGCLAMYLAGEVLVDVLLLTDVHAGWRLLGWVIVLTASVSFQVIPMFQGIDYPRALAGALPAELFVLLLAWSVANAARAAPCRLAIEVMAGLLLASSLSPASPCP